MRGLFCDAGFVRYKAAGEPRQFTICADRTKWRRHKIRRKTEAERLAV